MHGQQSHYFRPTKTAEIATQLINQSLGEGRERGLFTVRIGVFLCALLVCVFYFSVFPFFLVNRRAEAPNSVPEKSRRVLIYKSLESAVVVTV